MNLSKIFFTQVIEPLLDDFFPEFFYTAALIGDGSEILGYDDEISTDHDWGPRVQIFYQENDREIITKIETMFQQELPSEIRGYPISWSSPSKFDGRTDIVTDSTQKINHKILFYEYSEYIKKKLGSPNFPEHITDWLAIPQQILCSLTAGEVFRDDIGNLTQLRQRITYYPEEIRLNILLQEWIDVQQNLAFCGRTGMVGDELGSRIIAFQQVKRLMMIAFLIERQYAPYDKWFGTAFAQLSCGAVLQSVFDKILAATNWQEREEYLASAYLTFGKIMYEQHLIPLLPLEKTSYHTRPQIVVNIGEITDSLHKKIQNLPTRQINRSILGSINTLTSLTSVLEYPKIYLNMKTVLIVP